MTKKFILSSLQCEVCGHSIAIPRPESLQRPQGHIKHMYCSVCKEKQAFVEQGNDSKIDFWEQYHNDI